MRCISSSKICGSVYTSRRTRSGSTHLERSAIGSRSMTSLLGQNHNPAVTRFPRRPWLAYFIALLAVIAALGLRGGLDPWLGTRVPYITAFGATIVAAWYGGFWPALLAALVGWLGSDFLFIEPRARQRAEQSDQRFRAFMANSPNGVFIKDEEGRYEYMNRTGEQLAGRTDWQGKTDTELLPQRVAGEIRAHD